MRKRFNLFRLILILGAFFFFSPFIVRAEEHSSEEEINGTEHFESNDNTKQIPQDEEINVEKPNEDEQIKEYDKNSYTDRINDTQSENNGEREIESKIILEEKESKKDNFPSEDSTNPEKSSGEEKSNPTSEETEETQRSREMIQPQQTPGLIDVQLLTNSNLNAEYSFDDKHIITLTYRGYGALDLSLLSNTYAIFNLPPEIMQLIELETTTVSATYDVPMLGILIPILRDDGEFSEEDIEISGNQIYMNFFNLLSLNLLSYTNYDFTLTIELEELPPTSTGEYIFYAESTNQLVDLSIISGSPASATLTAPPEAPVINEPIYNNHTIVEGTGLPGTNVELTIGEQIINGVVGENGNFQIAIEEQVPGTMISAVLINEVGMRSQPDTAIVQEATISFYHVPEYILFEPTELKPGFHQIPIVSTDGMLSVVDTRGEGSPITIQAHAEPLFNQTYNHTLPNALIYKDERGETHNLFEESLVYSGITGEDQITEIMWNENQGTFVEVDPSKAYEGTYESTITWTLVDGP